MKLANMLVPIEVHARVAGKSCWQLRYVDGRVIDERDVDWSLAPHRGRMAIRLVCPNGKVAELGNTKNAEGRILQLKGGTLTAGKGRRTDFHLIGLVTGTDGHCRCYAWEYGPGRLVQFEDNVGAMRYQSIGRLNFEVLGIRPD